MPTTTTYLVKRWKHQTAISLLSKRFYPFVVIHLIFVSEETSAFLIGLEECYILTQKFTVSNQETMQSNWFAINVGLVYEIFIALVLLQL